MKKHRALHALNYVVIWLGGSLLLAVLLLWISVSPLQVAAETSESAVTTAVATDLGYGFNVAAWDVDRLQAMGFNWIKVFNGPGSRLPVNVLLRVDANASHMGDVSGFGDSMAALAQAQKGFVDAYEIGNEPNLNASYGWTTTPNATDYAALLCEAYGRIKAIDPNARVISAGLAPTGRVKGEPGFPPGHNGDYQDEREFFKEMMTAVAAQGGACLDGVGYHPYGFSADFDAAPDINLGTDATNCSNGFCFRGVEKIYELMQTSVDFADKTIWATEFGWIVTPPDYCLSDGSWDGRLWQIVSEQKQADNLVGAFQYAATNWPWMEAMMVFNLNFNKAGYAECEQMRFYGVQDRPAEAALSAMPKVIAPDVGELTVSPAGFAAMITPGQLPFSQTVPIELQNVGTAVLTYTAALNAGSLSPTLVNPGDTISPTQSAWITMTMSSASQPTGTYSADLTLHSAPDTIGAPVTMPFKLFIVEEIYNVYLPIVIRSE